MPWNPNVYNQFKDIRNKPFYDLLDFIVDENLETAVDLGCGTGEQTSILAQKFPNTIFKGIDSSEEMLRKSEAFKNTNLSFELKTIETFINSNKQYDLIFSNAALQWIDNHKILFKDLIQRLNHQGQFAIQIPDQPSNLLNRLLVDLANQEPYKNYLNGWNLTSPVLDLDDYSTILFEEGLRDCTVMKKVYPIIAQNVDDLFNFISGSALIPYLERIEEKHHSEFLEAFKQKIKENVTSFPAIYSFKRIIVYGRKE